MEMWDTCGVGFLISGYMVLKEGWGRGAVKAVGCQDQVWVVRRQVAQSCYPGIELKKCRFSCRTALFAELSRMAGALFADWIERTHHCREKMGGGLLIFPPSDRKVGSWIGGDHERISTAICFSRFVAPSVPRGDSTWQWGASSVT